MRHWIAVLTLVVACITSLFSTQSAPVSLAATAAATQAAASNCDVAGATAKVAAFKPTGDSAQDQAALIALEADLQAMNAACNGLVFTGSTDTVLGIIDFPAGDYLITITTRGTLIFSEKAMGGESCEPGSNIQRFILAAGDATEGVTATELIRQECRVRFAVSKVSLPYSISIVPLYQNTRLVVQVDSSAVAANTTASPTAGGPTATQVSAADAPGATRTAIYAQRTATSSAATATASFLAQYKRIDVRELANYADNHRGEKVIVQGYIFNIIRSTIQIFGNGNFTYPIYIDLAEPPSGIYTNDYVTVYGTVFGFYTFTDTQGHEARQAKLIDAFVKK